jgi:hypothetical protein
MKVAMFIAAASAVAASGAPALRAGSEPDSEPDSQLAEYCESNFKGVVVQIQMVSDAHLPDAQYGVVDDFCEIDINGTQVVIGLENVDPNVPTIAATMLKTARAVDPAKMPTYGYPATAICQGYGGTDAAFVALNPGFTDAGEATDVCVFGDGSKISAWLLAYAGTAVGDADSPFQAIRDAVADQQVFLGVTPPGDIFVDAGLVVRKIG